MDFLTVKESEVSSFLDRLLSKLPCSYRTKYSISTVCIYVEISFDKNDYESIYKTDVNPLEQINFYSTLYFATGSHLSVVDTSDLVKHSDRWYTMSLFIRCDYQIIHDK